jgi:lipoprotein NlpI
MKARLPSAQLRRSVAQVLFVACCFASFRPCPGAETPSIDGPLRTAEAAFKKKDYREAIALADKIIAGKPADFRIYFLRARAYEELHQYDKSVTDLDAGLKLNPKASMGYQFRGMQHFRLGNFTQSVADFDKYLEEVPAQAPYHWQRGISLYYAKRFEDGRKQFELHQTVNPNDVENAVWHFLCVTRASGLEKARAALIPIERDARVPMMKIHALFAGKAKPEDVLAAAKDGTPPAAELDNRLFYAHLYLGLYFEAIGDMKLAREHIFKAATGFTADHYMGDVARVHAQVLRKQPGG